MLWLYEAWALLFPSRQRQNKNVDINASSQDDFENKCLHSYHVTKSSQ